MFKSYESEWRSIIDGVPSRIEQVGSYESDSRARRNLLKQIEVDLGQADSLLRQMEVEARGDPDKKHKGTLRGYKNEMKEVKADFERAKEKAEREELMSRGGGSSFTNAGADERRRFEEVTARMERGTESLLHSKQTLAETEDIALGITEQLASNRSTILSAHGKVRETGGLIGQASRILRGMQRRETRRKILLGFVILLLIGVIALIIYFATKKGEGEGGDGGGRRRLLLV